MKSSHFWLRFISWFVLMELSAWTIGNFFDFSFVALALAIVLGIITVHMAFPEIWEWLKTD